MLNIVKIGSNAKGNEVIWQMIIKQRKKKNSFYVPKFIYILFIYGRELHLCFKRKLTITVASEEWCKPCKWGNIFILFILECHGGQKKDRVKCLALPIFLGYLSLRFRVVAFVYKST